MKVMEGTLDGAGLRVAVLVSRFNEVVGDRLLQGALGALERRGVKPRDVLVGLEHLEEICGPE